MDLIASIDTQISYSPKRSWYDFCDRDSQTLLITAGDSWTWGDMMRHTLPGEDNDREHRVKHTYGNVLSDRIKADWINIGMPGGANITTISTLFETVIPNIIKDYSKIIIVLGLTEIGRELPNGVLQLRDQYETLRDQSWPTWNQLIKGEYQEDSYHQAMSWMTDERIFFRHQMQLHHRLVQCRGVEDFLLTYESVTFDIIQQFWSQLDQAKFHLVIGKNFVSNVGSANRRINNCTILDNIWCDVISQQGNLSAYPHPVQALTGISVSSLTDFVTDILKIKNGKQQLEELLNSSLKALDWLDQSPYNSRVATRHPQELAHRWWAEYIHKELNSLWALK